MMLREKCHRCGSAQFLEVDEHHGFRMKTCLSGHLNGYLDPDGEVTTIREIGGTPAAQLSTREWARDLLSDVLLQDLEALPEGAYGDWE
jgi:hypothetical protein